MSRGPSGYPTGWGCAALPFLHRPAGCRAFGPLLGCPCSLWGSPHPLRPTGVPFQLCHLLNGRCRGSLGSCAAGELRRKGDPLLHPALSHCAESPTALLLRGFNGPRERSAGQPGPAFPDHRGPRPPGAPEPSLFSCPSRLGGHQTTGKSFEWSPCRWA